MNHIISSPRLLECGTVATNSIWCCAIIPPRKVIGRKRFMYKAKHARKKYKKQGAVVLATVPCKIRIPSHILKKMTVITAEGVPSCINEAISTETHLSVLTADENRFHNGRPIFIRKKTRSFSKEREFDEESCISHYGCRYG